MKDIDIIKQLMAGNHLEKDELQRARELLTNLLNNAPKVLTNMFREGFCL